MCRFASRRWQRLRDCKRSLPAAAAVDHFIPWSRYPRDLAHNLVLAHGACNSRKSDLLGGEIYLGRWAQFVSDHDADLLAIGTESGLLVDRPTSVAVAEWSYGTPSACRPRCGSAGRSTGTCRRGGGGCCRRNGPGGFARRGSTRSSEEAPRACSQA